MLQILSPQIWYNFTKLLSKCKKNNLGKAVDILRMRKPVTYLLKDNYDDNEDDDDDDDDDDDSDDI